QRRLAGLRPLTPAPRTGAPPAASALPAASAVPGTSTVATTSTIAGASTVTGTCTIAEVAPTITRLEHLLTTAAAEIEPLLTAASITGAPFGPVPTSTAAADGSIYIDVLVIPIDTPTPIVSTGSPTTAGISSANRDTGRENARTDIAGCREGVWRGAPIWPIPLHDRAVRIPDLASLRV